MSDRLHPRPVDAAHHDRGSDSPTDWAPMIEGAFKDRLLTVLGRRNAGPWPRPVLELLDEHLAAGQQRAHRLVANSMDAANVRFGVLAVAAYEVLEPVVGGADAAAIVDDCLNGPLRAQLLAATEAVLDEADDAFSALVAASKDREAGFFGPSFRFERPVDDRHCYVLDVPGCLFHETLVVLGRPELQPILCRFDLNWADAIDPGRHHLRFARPVTFASGTTCHMVFTREEHLPGLVVRASRGPSAPEPGAGSA